jgi:hypothetical protein
LADCGVGCGQDAGGWSSGAAFFPIHGLLDPDGHAYVDQGVLSMTFAAKLNLIAAYAALAFVVAIVLGVF